MGEGETLHRYSAFNLGVQSSLLLPELLASAEAKKDITIRVETSERPTSDDNLNPDYSYSVTKTKARLYFSQIGAFLVENGREITAQALPNVEERLIRLPLLGAALATLLYQRGKFVLHASAVAVGDGAAIFIGNKGHGKSTTAAMLCSRGHQLLADDIVAIDTEENSRYAVLPGFPQFKLYPDSVTATFSHNPEKLEEVGANMVKRSLRVENFCQRQLPLRAVFTLGFRDGVSIRRLASQEAIKYLIVHTYMARFSTDWVRNGIAASNLQQSANVAAQVPVYQLERPRDFSALEEVALAVEKVMNV
jgi:hypothetical protein